MLGYTYPLIYISTVYVETAMISTSYPYIIKTTVYLNINYEFMTKLLQNVQFLFLFERWFKTSNSFCFFFSTVIYKIYI